MKKLITISVLIIMCINLSAQIKHDAVSIFKMQLFLNNNKNYPYSKKNDKDIVVKNDSLYEIFNEIVQIKLDSLRISGEYEFMHNSDLEYVFYKFSLYNLSYLQQISDNKDISLNIPHGLNTEFILAIHTKTSASYRIKGFDGNDFLSFLSDFKEDFYSYYEKKLTTRHFLRGYHVEGIDFKCLYQGLTAKEIDRNKYPCLKRVSDPIIIY